ncbi:MAG: alpha/beta fold hydrolase, partial [Steroidobacteraceae bacterium]
LQGFAREALRPSPRGYELKCDPALRSHFASTAPRKLCEALRSLECPVLVVRGAISALLSEAGATRTVAAARHARVATVAAAGHGILLENPAGLADAVQPFVGPFLNAGGN